MVAVAYEDRAQDIAGLKVLLRSLAKFEPGWSVRLYLPGASAEVEAWCRAQPLKEVTIVREVPRRGWNAKPWCLLDALRAGARAVVWFDTDVVLTRAVSPLLDGQPEELFIGTEELPYPNFQGTGRRAAAWGLEVARDIPRTINSSVVRVDATHMPLLQRWDELLESPEYVRAQGQPFGERPLHMRGDQDVLNALLGSRAFAAIPVRQLRCGRDIAQCCKADGFSPLDRLRHAFRSLPPLVHAMGGKPWRDGARALHLELSPYSWVAARLDGFAKGELDWTQLRSPLGRLLNGLALGDPSLRGFLPALCASAPRTVGRAVRRVLRLRPSGG